MLLFHYKRPDVSIDKNKHTTAPTKHQPPNPRPGFNISVIDAFIIYRTHPKRHRKKPPRNNRGKQPALLLFAEFLKTPSISLRTSINCSI